MKKISALLLALCMALSLAACGSKDPDTTASLPPAPSGTESGAPSTARALGGDLVLPFTSTMGEFFNPYKQGNLIEYGWPCYEPLAQLKPDGQWHPCLAESWEVDGEGHTITVKLRQGVTFHNGDTLDADDLVFTLQSRLDYGTASAIGNPSAVEKVDDYTVRVRWDAFSLDYELWILKEYVYSKSAVEDNGLDWILNNMVGTGPYVMSEFIPDVHLRFTRSDSYWRPGHHHLPILPRGDHPPGRLPQRRDRHHRHHPVHLHRAAGGCGLRGQQRIQHQQHHPLLRPDPEP